MSLCKKISVIAFGFICYLLMVPAMTAQAASEVTVATLDELQPHIETALETFQSSYTATYTGTSLITSTQLNTLFNNISSVDGNDYICNVMKTRTLNQTGTAGNYKIVFTFTYWETAEQVAAVEKKVTEVLTSLGVSGMNDYQKEKAIHDWIVSNVIYDTTYANHSAYAAITTPYKTVCQGYALLAYKMFTMAGLQARIITGTGNGDAHAWNLVKVDGNWYQIDLTWDDPISTTSTSIHYDYYNMTDQEIGVGHKWSGTYPAAATEFSDVLTSKLTSDSGNATIYQGLIDDLGLKYLAPENTCSSYIDIQYKLQAAIAKQQTEVKFRYTNRNTLANDIKVAATALGYITTYQYTPSDYTRTTSTSDVMVVMSFVSTIPIKATSISISNNALNLVLGGAQATLTATVAPSNASTKTVAWTTSDAAVATVSNGVVRAVGGGSATITATSVDGGFAATCTVTVKAAVTGVKLNVSKLILTVGGSDGTLTPTLIPSSASIKDVTWTSSNTDIATISNGTVHPVACGSTIITVKTADGSKTATCMVTVFSPATGVTISVPTLSLKLGSTATLTAAVTPSTAFRGLTWKSSNEAVAKVSTSGLVTPVDIGTATITATTSEGNLSATCTVNVIRGVTGITLNKPSLTMRVGDADETLTAAIVPTSASIQTTTWKSSNTNVVTVDSNGKVHAVAPGRANIVVASTQNTGKTAKCAITVYDPATGISLSATSLTQKIENSVRINATVIPSTANKGVTWKSSNESIAKVSATGQVTPVAVGTATITATTTDGGFTATCTVTIIRGVTGITLNKTSLIMKVGAADETLTASILPSTATIQALTWKSSNTNVVTVDANGKVHAVAPGTVTVTATSTQNIGKYAKCAITVYNPVTGITLTSSTLALKLGKTAVLRATVTPSNANRVVTWKSSNESIVKVSATGQVTPIAVGTATITATTSDGGFTSDCAITVILGVTGITLNNTALTMLTGDSDVTLTATINPSTASVQTLTWKSSNTDVASVDSTGKVHAVAPGVAMITATSTQDITKIAKCIVTIYNPITGITLSASDLTIKMGYTSTLRAVVAPATSNRKVTWKSSNEAVAKVSTYGLVTPVSAGSATITATASDGSHTANCAVTVIQGVTRITLDKTALSFKVGDADITLIATIAPTTASVQTVTWKSSNTGIITVDSAGKVHAVAPGTAIVTVASTQDPTKAAKCFITVTAAP